MCGFVSRKHISCGALSRVSDLIARDLNFFFEATKVYVSDHGSGVGMFWFWEGQGVYMLALSIAALCVWGCMP